MLRSIEPGLPTAPGHAFTNGLFTGLAAAAVLVHAWFAVLLAPLRDTYRDFGDADLPCLTQLMIAPAWLWGMTATGAVLVVLLVARRPARRGPYVATALMLLATVVATFVLSQTPLRQLADKISDEPPAEMQLTPIGP